VWESLKIQDVPVLDFPAWRNRRLAEPQDGPRRKLHFGGSTVGGSVYNFWKTEAKMEIPEEVVQGRSLKAHRQASVPFPLDLW